MLKKNLEQREKPELLAIIPYMLRQEPELQWLRIGPIRPEEELDAKGNQSVGDVLTQNIYGFSPRIAENGSHHKGE